jgi:hypothetical protein
MAEDTTYNGWTNYETWNVALWLANEEPSYLYWREATRDAWKGARADDSATRKQRAAYALALRLKDELTEGAPEVTGTYADLLGRALASVNWDEIAGHMVEDEELEEDGE